MLECAVKEITEVGPKDSASLRGNACDRSAMAERSHASFIREPLMWVGCGGVYVKYRPSLEGCRM